MPGGTVEIFEVIAGTDPDMPATYGPLVTGGLVDTAGSFIAADLLEGDYVVCADGTGSVAPSCEIVTVFDNAQTIVNNVDLPGMISAEITDTMGGNEIQSYDDFPFACCVVNGGTYSLSFDGEGPSATLDFDATAAEVEAALEGLTNIDPGDVIVTGGPPPVGGPAIVIEFAGQYEGVDVPQLVVNSMLTRNGNPGATWFFDPNGTDQDGFGTTQTLTADARVSGGTFTLSYDGEETAPLDFDATVSEIEAALNALTTINGGGGSVQAFSTWPLTTPLDPQITLAPIEINFVNVPDSDTTVLDVDNSNLT